MLTSSDADSPATDDRSPHEFHTSYYDKEGSTHDVLTEVDVEGNQKVIQDFILVYGSGHED